jgi:anti-anti-sigma regulatory factor
MPPPKKATSRTRARTATTASSEDAPGDGACSQAASTPVAAAPNSLLQLGASLSIREVSECASQLKTMLANGSTDIDLSKLENIDTAGLQLLLVAAVSAQRRGFKVKLIGAQGLRTGAARSLGLHDHLGELAEVVS